jgi:hypothetical protein
MAEFEERDRNVSDVLISEWRSLPVLRTPLPGLLFGGGGGSRNMAAPFQSITYGEHVRR